MSHSCIKNLHQPAYWHSKFKLFTLTLKGLHNLMWSFLCISSVQLSHSVMSDSLRPHGLQHTRPPCSSTAPGVCSNSCPLSQWCHLTISFSIIPFSSCLQSFLAPGSFPMSQFFSSGGQWNFSFGINPSNEYSGLISFRTDCLISVDIFQKSCPSWKTSKSCTMLYIHVSHSRSFSPSSWNTISILIYLVNIYTW